MKILPKYIFLLLILCCHFAAFPQIHDRFSNITVRDGLSHGWVNAIAQDRLGFMWFATNDGLNKYDGRSFQIFSKEPGNSNSLSSNFISILYIDKKDNLWIGSDIGLNIYNIETDEMSRLDLGGEYYISGIAQLDSQHMAFCSSTGMFVYNTISKQINRYFIDSNQIVSPINRFRAMVPYKDYILTFSGGGLYKFDIANYTFDLITPNNSKFNGDNVRTLHLQNEIMWIGNTGDGLFFLDLAKGFNIKRFNNPKLKQSTIFSIYQSNINEIVLGCENQGLIILNPNERYNKQPKVKQIYNEFEKTGGLINNSVYSIFKDVQNNLWFGTYNGISYQYGSGLIFGSIIKQSNNPNSLNNNMVNSIIESDDNIWVGTEKGIDIFTKTLKKDKHISYSNSKQNTLLGSAILAMEKDFYGNIWVGSWAGGIDIINTQGKIIYKIQDFPSNRNLSNNSIMAIAKDLEDNMWVGTMGNGIYVFSKDREIIKHFEFDFTDSKSLSNNWIKNIMVTASGEIWISTHVNLELYNSKTENFVHFPFSDSIPNSIAGNGVECITQDLNDNIWMGTPSGLSLFNRCDSSFTNYYKKHGLPNNYIQSLACDNNGILWIGTNSGLSKLNTNSLANLSFENYDVHDGLIGNIFVRRASYVTKNGRIFLGTRNGLIYFDPSKTQTNNYIPEIYITELYVNNKKIHPNDESNILSKNIIQTQAITLNFNQSNLSFGFAALNYVVPGKNQYKYKLEGFDNEWINLDNKQRASYTNIPHGNYTFKVIASNNSGLWNNIGTQIQIKIKPPWYRTKLAYIVFLTFIFLLILSYRHFIVAQTKLEAKLKLEQIEKDNLNNINRMKTRFFTNISHEFLTPLSLIISPLESIINSVEFNVDFFRKSINPIYKNAIRLQRLINQLLDISKIEGDHLKLKVSKGPINDFIYDIYMAFKSLADHKNIQFNYNSKIKNELFFFDSDKIEKILYNLISNAFKFTPEKGAISLNIDFDDVYLKLEVTDNGSGIDDNEKSKVFESFYRSISDEKNMIQGTGVGLSLVQGLVNVYGGKILLESKKGEGSTFIVLLPYKHKDFSESAISDKESKKITSIDLIDDFTYPDKQIEYANQSDTDLPKILIVEDNAELNGHLVEVLSKNYHTTSAFNGLQGFNLAKSLIPDIIVSDIVMPEMDGITLLKEIRNNENTSHIPIILLTTKVAIEDKIIGLESGADAYIPKPFNQKHLESSIANLILTRKKLKELYKKRIVIEPTQIEITSVDEKFIAKAIKIVEEQLSNPDFTVEVLGSEIGMSRVQLHRKLTGLLGMSASSFIREIKIKRAAELLVKGQLTVSEVMYEVNIKSRAYFIKCFKEKYGVLPTEYAKTGE